MVDDKNLKLAKCVSCGKSFYIKTKVKGTLKIKCPYCEQDVNIKINGSDENVSA